MNTWHDTCFTGAKSSILELIFPGVGLFCGLYYIINAFLLPHIRFVDKVTFFLGSIFISYLIIFLIKVFREKQRTIKTVILGSEKIIGHCYYGKNFIIQFDEIKSVETIRRDFFMKNMRLFYGREEGLDILMKDGRLYRVSSYLTDLSEFHNLLAENIH